MTRIRAAVAAAAIAAGLTLALASGAQAASYYNIVNTDTGKALEATTSGVRLAPLKRTNQLQQWKRINKTTFGDAAGIQNRLLGCLRTNTTTVGNLVAPLGIGSCAGADSDARKRWYHLVGGGTPDVPGYHLVSVQTVEYVADISLFDVCLAGCPQTYDAFLVESGFAADLGGGGPVKWSYRFAESAP